MFYLSSTLKRIKKFFGLRPFQSIDEKGLNIQEAERKYRIGNFDFVFKITDNPFKLWQHLSYPTKHYLHKNKIRVDVNM